MGSASEIPPDTLLGGKIRLIQRIGRGGMGDVWIARNESTQAEVAVKTLAKSVRTATHDERFRREGRLAATISHRNVVRIFDLVDSDGTLGLVMELLRGGTLEASVRENGALSALQAIAVAAPILSALHHVHTKGIIHRDVTPANIFFAVEPDGHVIPKILDFGIAKLPAASSALTMDGSVLGTPHYMSPEQIRGEEALDGRSDMFSLAVVLYEMLTGNRVFRRDTAAASLAAVLEYDVDPDPRIEPRLWVALSRALAKRPYERYATCNEFADALRAAIDASEEDLAQSLQELRPATAAVPIGSVDSGVSVSGSGRAQVRSRSVTSRGASRKTVVLALTAAVGAAIFAVGLTLAITHSGKTASADESPPPPNPVNAAPAPPPREAIPLPAAAGDATSTTTTTSATPAPVKPVSTPRPSTAKVDPPIKPTGKKRDVATKPDF